MVLTKLDGTARGGIALAIARELALPVKLIGVGESVEDLRPFDPRGLRARADRRGLTRPTSVPAHGEARCGADMRALADRAER